MNSVFLTTNFSDIFKSNFMDNITSFSVIDCVISMLLAFAVGLFIFAIYQKTFSGVMYSRSFGISLMALTLITTLVIVAVTSNVVLSLGMVGALSIVRFRTAIKEPMDICFLFWSIGVGIVIGAGMYPLAVFGSVFIGILLLIFVNKKSRENPYIFIVNCDNNQAEQDVLGKLPKEVKHYQVKSKTVSKNGIELTLEVRLTDAVCEMVNRIAGVEGVSNAVLVSYNGEYMS